MEKKRRKIKPQESTKSEDLGEQARAGAGGAEKEKSFYNEVENREEMVVDINF